MLKDKSLKMVFGLIAVTVAAVASFLMLNQDDDENPPVDAANTASNSTSTVAETQSANNESPYSDGSYSTTINYWSPDGYDDLAEIRGIAESA